MGFLVGPLQFIGKVGGLVYTKTPKGTQVTEYSRLSRKRLLKSKEFENSRKSSTEFGGGAALAGKFYEPLKNYGALFSMGMWNNLCEECRRVVYDDIGGVWGSRSADLRNNGATVLNFDMGHQSLDSVLRFPYDAVIADDRKSVTWSIPLLPFTKITGRNRESTSCKFIMSAVVVPKLVLGDDKKYVAYGPTKEAVYYFSESHIINLNGAIPAMDLIIELDSPPQDSDAIVVTIGIAFYELVVRSHSFVKDRGALKLVKIG